MNDTSLIIQQCYEASPADIKRAVDNFLEKLETTEYIGKKNGLDEKKVSDLQIEIYLTLLGISPLSEFRINLTRRIGTTYDQALKISSEINSQIFSPVLETLKGLEQGDNNIATVQKQPGVEKPQTPYTIQPEPTKFIPDHEEMERVDGPHLHSQNLMPAPQSMKPVQKPQPQTQSQPQSRSQPQSSVFQSKNPFKSIVDQKLSGVVRSSSSIFGYQKPAEIKPAPENQPQPTPKPKYEGNDPYREPLK